MPAYDAGDFDPPAPVARAVVSTADLAIPDVPMLLDSGADISVVPRAVAARVGVVVGSSNVLLQTYDGTQVEAEVAELSLQLGAYRFRGQFVIGDADHGILGRNILNLLVLTLDGPRQQWSV
jgi:hypothetical protein